MAELPKDARRLGGHVKDGLGEYYREMMALKRVLEQNSQGNWESRYLDQGKPDHYAHAEAYCLRVMRKGCGLGLYVLGGRYDDEEPYIVLYDLKGPPFA